jgi:transposase
VNKSDKLDAKGMNRLQRTGTLPTVWIPSSSVRDARELPRTRMVLSRQRTQLKNRVHATLSKYGYAVEGVSDAFGKRGQKIVMELMGKLPPHTQQALQRVLDQLGARRRESQSDRSRNDQGFCSMSRNHLA